MSKVILIPIVLLLLLFKLPADAQIDCVTNTSGPAGKSQTASQIDPSAPYDQSNWFPILMAAEGGSGFSPGSGQPAAYAGAKLGVGNVLLDFGYDRVRTQNGFSTQFSGMLPVLRFPGPQKDQSKNYLRVYAEPGIGYRAGGGGFGGYLSGGIMVALLSDKRLDFNRLSPYVEYQRRAPFAAPGHGDNRFSFGVMLALCVHCGFD